MAPGHRIAALLTSALALAASNAAAEPPAGVDTTQPAAPESKRQYLQYGVALAAEGVASAGPICKEAAFLSPLFSPLTRAPSNCILGSGGGISARAGWRPSEVLYVGGAYEMTKQDPNQLYRLGILQQVRFEARRYFPNGREGTPFVLLTGGVHGYGNEWGIDTWGLDASAGGGIEVELGGPVLDLSLAYRAMYFRAWTDTSEIPHDSGVAQFLSFEIAIEAKDAL